MNTPFIDRVHRGAKLIAISFNLRKWRYVLPFLKKPSVFISASVFVKDLNRLLGRSILVNKPSSDFLKELAEQALAHKITVLGSLVRTFKKMPWHEDVKSGKVWEPGKYFSDYVQIDAMDESDVKVPWEISRCHHLLYLGQAYQITKEEQYAKEIVDQIEDWINENPLMYSINWTCSMEVAIRAVNWMWAVYLISGSSVLNDDFARLFSKSLYEHGFFIYNNLENADKYNANHYFSDIVGLLFLGALFRGNKKANEWFEYALAEFQSEIRTQFLPSGFHYERSISYHRLMTEMTGYAWALLKRMDIQLPMDVTDRIERMFIIVADYLKPNGMAPNIGDEDDGRFLPFVKYDFHYHAYLLDIYYHLTGKKLNHDYNHSTVYNDAGFGIVRQNGTYLFVSNGGVSKYPEFNKWARTHSHNDLLSFEFFKDGKDIIIDPGTFAYTSDFKKRHEYRKTAKHNTIQIDGKEQYTINERKPFDVYVDCLPMGLSVDINQNIIELRGAYHKKNSEIDYKHFRTFRLNESGLVIEDEVDCLGEHELNAFFHYDEKDTASPIRTVSSGVQLEYRDDSVSTSYGVEKNSKTLVFRTRFIDKVKSTYSI